MLLLLRLIVSLRDILIDAFLLLLLFFFCLNISDVFFPFVSVSVPVFRVCLVVFDTLL